MPAPTLIRLGGLSAMLAGLLRAGSSFIPLFTTEQGIFLEALYLITDLLILFGLLGVYGYVHERAGYWGFAGFVLALSGTAMIVGPDGRLGSMEMYILGALLISVGVVFLAIGVWRARQLSRWVPVLWVVSTVAGIGGFLMGQFVWSVLIVIAGVAFGLAFVLAGANIWADAASDQAAIPAQDRLR
ncbi:MAG TPA: hypothetical protein VK900_08640 [Anaerolineales bacterium]|nr:hypothetical protein [Anaerolineales bacterium]